MMWRKFLLVLMLAALILPVVTVTWNGPAEAQERYYTMRYWRVHNQCDQPIRLYVKFRTKTCRDCDFHWVPGARSSSKAYTYDLDPGERAILAVDGEKITASGVQYWAKSRSGKTTWEQYRDDTMWLVKKDADGERRYRAEEMGTWTTNFTCE